MNNFNRWGHCQLSTWPFQVYKKYNEELSRYIWANDPLGRYAYKHLKKDKAKWEDDPNMHFTFTNGENHNFVDLEAWSNNYKSFNKWTLLNVVVAMSSNLETYIGAVVSLAIESNPGTLLGASKTIDGTILLKSHLLPKDKYAEYIEKCTRGAWDMRLSHFKGLFGGAPAKFEAEISTLEKIRKLRNKVSHAFGRDIESSRNFQIKETLPIETISFDRVIRYLNVVYDIARSIDSYLLEHHIGEFQTILAYHHLQPSLDMNKHRSERAMAFKKYYGAIDQNISKSFCKELVDYYESIK